jgi:hypothetical protein
VEKILALLEQREGKGSERIQPAIRIFILINLINENGGIATEGENLLVEDLTWISQVTSNPHVNRGNQDVEPQVVGFYKPDFTFDKAKENKKPFPGMVEVDKFMNIFPTLDDYFIAAKKGTPFITELIAKIAEIFTNHEKIKK